MEHQLRMCSSLFVWRRAVLQFSWRKLAAQQVLAPTLLPVVVFVTLSVFLFFHDGHSPFSM